MSVDLHTGYQRIGEIDKGSDSMFLRSNHLCLSNLMTLEMQMSFCFCYILQEKGRLFFLQHHVYTVQISNGMMDCRRIGELWKKISGH